jgi:hypothetical protein
MKTCKYCEVSKELSYFNKHPNTRDGYAHICKECYYNKYNEINKKRGRELYHKLKKEDPLKLRIKDWKDIGLNVTKEQYENLYNQQHGKCYCCGKHEDELSKKLCLDHCHTTMKLRGLLCTNCNIMIGNAKDNIETLQKAIEYLKQF